MEIARYRTAQGEEKIIDFDNGGFFVDRYPMELEQVLGWDASGLLVWVSPDTRSWAYGLRAFVPIPVAADSPQAAPAAAVPSSPAVATPAAAAAPTSAPTAAPVGTRAALLTDILAAISEHPGYRAVYGTDTDIAVDNTVADASWSTGKKKVSYEAIMKAVEEERVLYFWEMLKESSSGLSFGTMESESYTTSGMKRWGKTKEKVIGPGGVVVDYEWDYGKTRQLVESVCARHGFRLKVVLRKGSARY